MAMTQRERYTIAHVDVRRGIEGLSISFNTVVIPTINMAVFVCYVDSCNASGPVADPLGQQSDNRHRTQGIFVPYAHRVVDKMYYMMIFCQNPASGQ